MSDYDHWPDGDMRHVFVETARDKRRCHICLKDRDHTEHITEEQRAAILAHYVKSAK